MEKVSKQKNIEWKAISNVIPMIERHLNLENINHNTKYESESPDFIFYNDKYSIGIEVVECHPSVQDNKKRNAPALESLKNKICMMFKENVFFKSITKRKKLNILIDCGRNFDCSIKPEDACKALEKCLRAWYSKEKYNDFELIAQIRVQETIGENVVQFNLISRRNPISFQNLKHSLLVKELKLTSYIIKTECTEYWLCIYLPFNENSHLNNIHCDTEEQKVISDSKFDRFFVTSAMPNDLIWLKEG